MAEDNALSTYSKYGYKMFLSSQASLWQDIKLRINNKPLIWNEWSSRGIMVINDVITQKHFYSFAVVVKK